MSADLSNPATNCVYRHYDRYGNLLYVGITNRGERRMKEHARDKIWWSVVNHSRYEHYDNREAALEREEALIRAYNPPFNTQHNDVSDEMRAVYLEHAPDAIVRSRPESAVNDNSFGSYKYRPDKPFEERDHLGEVEVREAGDITRIVGYAALFNRYSSDLGGFVEQIEPGAFKRVLGRGDDVQAWFNHNPDNLLASTASGTLRLEEDEVGLRYEFEMDSTDPDHQRVLSKIKRGDLRGSSFGFRVEEDDWGATDSDYPLRTIKSVGALRDVGPVSTPAYPSTASGIGQVALRSLADLIDRPLEELVEASESRTLKDYLLTFATESETSVTGDHGDDDADLSFRGNADSSTTHMRTAMPPPFRRAWLSDYS